MHSIWHAGYPLLSLVGPKGISCFIVEKGTPGLSFGNKEKKVAVLVELNPPVCLISSVFQSSPLLSSSICLPSFILQSVSSSQFSCLSPLLSLPACLISSVFQPVSSLQFSSLSSLLSSPVCLISSVFQPVSSLQFSCLSYLFSPS